MTSKLSKRNFIPKCLSTDPPFSIFIASLVCVLISFLLLALHIHLVPLPAWELNHRWNRLTMGLGHQTFCVDNHGFDEETNYCISTSKLQFSIKAQVNVESSLFNQQDSLSFYSCFNRLNIATDIDTLSVVKNTYFSLSLNISANLCESNQTICSGETDVCVGVSSTDEIVLRHIEKLDIVPRPPKCTTLLPARYTQKLIPLVIHPNVSMCDLTRVQPLLQPSNNWQLSRIFKDAFPLINLALTEQDKQLAVRHLLLMALLLLFTIIVGGIGYLLRSYFVCRPRK